MTQQQPRQSRFSFKMRLPFFAALASASTKQERKRRASSSEATRENNGPVFEAAAFEGHTAQKTDDSASKEQQQQAVLDRLCPLCRNPTTASSKKNKKSAGGGVVAVCKCRKGKNFFRRDPRRHSHAGTSEGDGSLGTQKFSGNKLEFFEDEADLFEGIVQQKQQQPQGGGQQQHSNATSLSEEDVGISAASFPSLSPSSSSEGNGNNLVRRRLPGLNPRPNNNNNNRVPSQQQQHLPQRPASCTFGNLDGDKKTFVKANFLDPQQGKREHEEYKITEKNSSSLCG